MEFRDDLRWGVRHGARYGLTLSALAAVVTVGAVVVRSEWDSSILWIFVIYLGGGLLGGVVVGAVRPLARTLLGGMVIGTFVVALPMYGFGMFHRYLVPHSRGHIVVTLFCSLIVGVYGGWSFWKREQEAAETEAAARPR